MGSAGAIENGKWVAIAIFMFSEAWEALLGKLREAPFFPGSSEILRMASLLFPLPMLLKGAEVGLSWLGKLKVSV